MLPIRHKSIFKSRWIALLWAGGIIWSAVEFVGGQSGTTSGNNAATSSDDQPSTADVQAAMRQFNIQ